jgi:hypothetical protein
VANQYYSGQMNYASLRPQMELQMGQSDWSCGFGLEYWDSSQSKRYYSTTNADARFKGMVIAGPVITTPTLPNMGLVVADSGLESWIDPTHLTYWSPASAVTRGGAPGNYYVQLDGGGTSIAQTITTWDNSYQNVYMVFQADLTTSFATEGRLTLNDGVGTTNGDYHSGGGTLEKCIVARKLANAASVCTLTVMSASGAVVIVDNILGPVTGAIGNFCEFNDYLYFSDGGYLLKVDKTTGAITKIAGFPWTITGLATFNSAMGGTAADYLIIAMGAGNYYYYMSTAEAFTRTDAEAYHLKTVGSSLYRSILPRMVSVTVDPINEAAWTTDYNVGAAADNITGLEDDAGTPVILKEDFPYYITTGGAVAPYMSSLVSEKSSTSGKNAINWQGKIYVPCGAQGLYENDDGTITDISPSKFITNNTDYDGQITALAGDTQYLYAFMDNGSKVEVLTGRWEIVDNISAWRWHPLSEVTLADANSAKASTVYKRRVWFGSSTGVLMYIPYTSMYGNITADTDYTYLTGGNMVTPWMHADLMNDYKAFIKLTLLTQACTANIYWATSYEKWGDSSYTSIGNYTTNSYETKYIPVSVVTLVNTTGTLTESGTALTVGVNTLHITGAGTFTFDIPAGITVSVANGTATVTPTGTMTSATAVIDSGITTGTIILTITGAGNSWGTMIRFKFSPVTNTPVTSPVLVSWDCRAIWYPKQKKTIQMQVVVGDNLRLNGGQRDEVQSAATIRTAIEAWINPTGYWPRAFYPPYYNSDSDNLIYCKVMPTESGNVCQMLKNEANGNIEWVYNLSLLVVTLS